MKYNVYPTPSFKREAKRLVKKYISLKEELLILESEIKNNPRVGTDLGNNTYKIRIAIKSKNKGKSGGARVITYVITEEHEIYLLKIYDKSELENISVKELRLLIEQITGKM